MTSETTQAIKKYSTDYEDSNALLALMNYYDVTNLHDVSESMGLIFLKKLQSGEITLPYERITIIDLQVNQGDD